MQLPVLPPVNGAVVHPMLVTALVLPKMTHAMDAENGATGSMYVKELL